jgi:hypothetical protein
MWEVVYDCSCMVDEKLPRTRRTPVFYVKIVTEIVNFRSQLTYCRSQWPCGLRRGSCPVGCWDRGFESRSRHGCLSASFCVVLSCVGRGLATG